MTLNEYNESVELYADGIYRFILKNIRDEDKAKDVVQDTYTKLWEKVGNVDAKKVKSYLFTTAYHTMIDRIRKDKREVDLQEAKISGLGIENGGYSDLKEILDKAVALLPDIQKSVLLLRDYEGYSYKEIAEITQLNESQVKVYIYRARVFLKGHLKSVHALI